MKEFKHKVIPVNEQALKDFEKLEEKQKSFFWHRVRHKLHRVPTGCFGWIFIIIMLLAMLKWL